MKRKCIFLILFAFYTLTSMAQNSCELGILPSININMKLHKDWSLNFKAESRQSLIKGDFNYDYLLTDLYFAAAKKAGINTTVTAGYLMRISDEGIRNRTIQQFSFIKRYTGFILAHRLSADQTFQRDDYTEFRFRYRLSAELPLSGQSLDPKEFFLKLNNEYLNSFYAANYDLEIRGAAFLGYVLSPENKVELGLEYRIDSFVNSKPGSRFWIAINFYQSI